MLANISIDVDGLWAALQYHGIASDPQADPAITEGVPRILRLLKQYDVSTTFFCVGKNVARHTELHKAIADAHEIANHSFSHPHDLARYEYRAAQAEIVQAHALIVERLGVTPVGFRAPTYGVSRHVLRVLGEQGYAYDSSFMPAFYPGITPVRNLLQKRGPHRIGALVELPVSVHPLMPVFVNGSAVIALGLGWLRCAMRSLQRFRRPLIINFHDRDAVALPPVLRKQFWRGKHDGLAILEGTIRYVQRHAQLVSLSTMADAYRTKEPRGR